MQLAVIWGHFGFSDLGCFDFGGSELGCSAQCGGYAQQNVRCSVRPWLTSDDWQRRGRIWWFAQNSPNLWSAGWSIPEEWKQTGSHAPPYTTCFCSLFAFSRCPVPVLLNLRNGTVSWRASEHETKRENLTMQIHGSLTRGSGQRSLQWNQHPGTKSQAQGLWVSWGRANQGNTSYFTTVQDTSKNIKNHTQFLLTKIIEFWALFAGFISENAKWLKGTNIWWTMYRFAWCWGLV